MRPVWTCWGANLRLGDLLHISFRQVMRQRRRYFGVGLIVALGTAGLILIITVGGQVKSKFNEDLDLLGGATLVKVVFQTDPGHRPQEFYPETVKAVRATRHVAAASRLASKLGFATSPGRRQARFGLVAVEADYWRAVSLQADYGRVFTAKEVAERQRVCVLGGDVARTTFGRVDVVGENLEIDNDTYRILGVVDGQGLGSRINMAFLPLTTAQDRIQRLTPPNKLYVRVSRFNDVEEVATRLPEVVTSKQSVRGLSILVAWTRLKRVKNVAFIIEAFVLVATFAALVLGGFGIWNMMMSAVRNRTREIGLKKAMGAEDSDILAQFLAETLALSLAAVLLGIILGRVGVELVSLWLGTRPAESLFFTSVGLGLVFALGIGVGAGLYPSIQAARMEVVYALRYE